MGLRYFTFSKVQYPDLVKKTLCFFLILFSHSFLSQNTPPKELKKEADQHFENGDYSKAYKLYSQLVANFPKDPEYNYRLGVCMIYSEPDKKKCLPYLRQSVSNPKEAPVEAYFYLGKAHHINYLFDAAIKYYQEFKALANVSLQKKLQVDREIQACAYGKELLSNMSDLVVQSKKELNEADFFRSYDLKGIGGKLLVKPEDFKTAADKKKKEKSVIFLPKGGNVVYYSSYGEDGLTGKDIYTASKLPNGTYSAPQKLPIVNTAFDEDYPYLHPNGNSLYFSSKGHNSMGGYDIFRSDYNEESNTWTTPVNLEFPINSPDDDFLFVTDSLGQTAFFSTGRQSPPGKIDVLKIKTERPPIDMVVIKGIAYGKSKEELLASTITVKNTKNELPVVSVTAEENGEYQLEVPNGSSLLFTVESPGFKTESKKIVLPLAGTSKLYKQTISYEGGVLKIDNDFDVKKNDSSYLAYLAIIEKKAKLNVNEGENKLTTPTVLSSDQPTVAAVATTNPTVKNDPPKTNSTINNNELLNLAKQDAVASKKEAQQLEADAEEATRIGQKQKEAADRSLDEAKKTITSAETITDAEEKARVIEQGTELEKNARNQQAVAVKIISVADAMRSDAKTKQREAELNAEYAKELENVIAGKNSTTSMRKLEELQKEIQLVVGKEKKSEGELASLRTELEEKEVKLETAEKQAASDRTAIAEIKQEKAQKETELSKTKKKAAKQELQTQIADLNKEQADKEQELAMKENEIRSLTEETGSLSNQLDIAQKVTAGTVASAVAINTNPGTSENSNTTTDPVSTTKNTESVTTAKIEKKEPPSEKTYEVIAAKNKEQAITKLDSISVGLEAAPPATSGEYTDESARKLMSEANQEIADASAKQDQLLKKVQAVRQKIAENKSSGATPESLNREAEQLLTSAQQLKSEARQKDGSEKQALEKRAKQQEEEANDKLISASEIAGTQNSASYSAISSDFKTLSGRNKSAANDRQQGEKLAAEADIAFKQAVDIRKEAEQMTAKGARLGNLSNAEEKEAEAIVKLQQAVDMLRKSDPEFVPSPPAGLATNNNEDLIKELKEVKDELDQLNSFRLSSYEKVYEANNLEIAALQSKFVEAKGVIDADPALRNARSESVAKLTEAQQTKDRLPSQPATDAKVTDLSRAVYKQNEALVIMKKLNEDIEKSKLATQTANVVAEPEVTIAATPSVTTEEVTVAATPSVTPEKENVNVTPTVLSPAIGIINPKDPPAKQYSAVVKNLSNEDRAPLRNSNAGTQSEQALERLQEYDRENRGLDVAASAAGTGGTTSEIKTKVEQILMEAEGLSRSAGEERREAETKTGEAKEVQLAQAAELQNESEDKSLAAATLMQKSNEAEIAVNDEAINELSEKLKEDNPGLLNEVNELGKQISFLKIQSRNMRSESDEQTNKSAKLGMLSNAEEKESQILAQQNEIMLRLKGQYPDYVLKTAVVEGQSPETVAAKKDQLRENQFRQLTNLTNAYNLEFETSKNSVPVNLSPALRAQRDSATVLSTEAKKLLISAQSVTDKEEKLAVLSRAALLSGQAAEKINSLVPEAAVAVTPPTDNTKATANTKTTTNTAATSTAAVVKTVTPTPTPTPSVAVVQKNTSSAAVVPNVPAGRSLVKIEGLEVIAGNAYSAAKPIPVDAAMADGLVFRVQIGAFRTKLPDNAFRGLNPLNAETTNSGYLRYTAGNFVKIENANAVKNDLRGLGYSDAFVVAYFNGKRISLGEAMAMLKKEGKTIDPNAPQSAGITANTNVPKAINNPAIQEAATITSDLKELNGLFYTIQIGVYNKQISRQRLYNLLPIYSEALANGLYRYTAGIYSDVEKLDADRARVVGLGIRDAFVAAYINGKRIPYNEAKQRQAKDASIKTATQKPIIFPAGSSALPGQTAEVNVPVKPFSNGVKNYPAPTAENGVKSNEQGVSFKVQIGAYSKEVPAEVADKFSSIKNWPVESKQLNNLFIYNIGNFSEPQFAKQLKEEAVRLGINDAFITVYRDGKKVYGQEAAALLAR